MSFVKETIRVMGVDVYCEHDFNGKPPIVLIHGYLASTYTYHKVLPLLQEHFSVLAIDLPGFGKSEKSKSFRYSFENYAKLVTACMDVFNISSAMLVGHSMGGQVVMNVAKFSPERVLKLVLLNSSGYLKRANRLLIFSSYLPFFHRFVHYHINKHDVKDVLKDVLYDHSLIDEDMIEQYKRPIMDGNFPHSLIRLLRHREGDLSNEELNHLQVPALLLWGKQDKVVPLYIGEKLEKELPQANLKVYDKVGHLITDERPREVVEDIVMFSFNK
ncbi:alpha/beta fold hydrolase [Aquisalibacillus elongatus]|uniref:Pimeloyl-ACP methyl ester carboxylesterase n=1 Tax=Aquisalibacillus elongatus TaxID=485577 RepID=A0A3N5AXW2_9BACI|nr:alpha/beta hydrolase [Aquisalibacillus elongatus]RPF50096.1 pimeloyl-ACP methyl ester carboxylesterase [Aquisalibacillus elongatus]